MRRNQGFFCAVLALATLLGCAKPKRCTLSTNVGVINVRVRDARTHAAICDATVFGGTTDGNRFELHVDADCVYSKRSLHIDGVYDIDVGHPQYELGERDGVTVHPVEDECEWFANVEIELQPKR